MTIIKNLSDVTNRIQKSAQQCQRDPRSITLLAVSKTWPAEKLQQLYQAGQRAFGENYLQEALTKIKQLEALEIDWHFIGPIQSNKTKDIAEHFDWVHSVDRLKIAERLSRQRPEHYPNLNICIQVNIDQEVSKSGIEPGALLSTAKQIADLPRLDLRGIMIIPAKTDDSAQQRAAFQRASELFEQLRQQHPNIDTLSMGMSNDLDIAIEQGSTLVRVGSALFGQRTTPN